MDSGNDPSLKGNNQQTPLASFSATFTIPESSNQQKCPISFSSNRRSHQLRFQTKQELDRERTLRETGGQFQYPLNSYPSQEQDAPIQGTLAESIIPWNPTSQTSDYYPVPMDIPLFKDVNDVMDTTNALNTVSEPLVSFNDFHSSSFNSTDTGCFSISSADDSIQSFQRLSLHPIPPNSTVCSYGMEGTEHPCYDDSQVNQQMPERTDELTGQRGFLTDQVAAAGAVTPCVASTKVAHRMNLTSQRIKKDKHNTIEQRRREKINAGLKELRPLVFNHEDLLIPRKVTKGITIYKAVEHIKQLRNENQELKRKLRDVEFEQSLRSFVGLST